MNYHYHILLISFLCLHVKTFSQDDTDIKIRHMVGVGLQYTPDKMTGHDHFRSKLNYNTPSPNLFYRFLLPNSRNSITAFTGDFFYRSGYGYTEDGGLGGYSSYSGNFEFVRFNIGAAQYGRLFLNKKNFIDIGGGTNIGRIIYEDGTITQNSFSLNSGSSTRKVSADKVLGTYCLSMNFEINLNIKLFQKHYLILGIKQFFQTSDAFRAGLCLTSNAFIAWAI